jgi:hypothetical protein
MSPSRLRPTVMVLTLFLSGALHGCDPDPGDDGRLDAPADGSIGDAIGDRKDGVGGADASGDPLDGVAENGPVADVASADERDAPNAETLDASDGPLLPDLVPDLVLDLAAVDIPPDVVDPGPGVDATVDQALDVSPDSDGLCGQDFFRSGDQCISRVVDVAAATRRTCAVLHSGQVWCWGGSAAATRPERVPELQDAKTVSLGGQWGLGAIGYGCAITAGERLLCWGTRSFGLLGDGDLAREPIERSRPRPVLLADGSPLEGVKSVGLGNEFACAATSSTLYCWGSNRYGQLAVPPPPPTSNDTYTAFAVPIAGVPVGALGVRLATVVTADATRACGWGGTDISHWPTWTFAAHTPNCTQVVNVAQVGAGFSSWCFRYGGGEVACWGDGVGANDLPGVRPAIGLAADVAVGAGHACAALQDGQAFCWGRLTAGELGTGEVGSIPYLPRAPVHVVSLGNDVVAVGSGYEASHTCAILKDGSLQCWGSNAHGQIGNSDAPAGVPAPVPVKW